LRAAVAFATIGPVRYPIAFAPAGVRGMVYRALWAAATVLSRAANGFLYLAAGVLRRDDLSLSSEILWGEYGTNIDDAGAGLDAWERELYAEFLHSSDRVLLIGCGTGRDMLALLERGYEVTGVEPVAELVGSVRRHLEQRRLRATVIEGFIQTATLAGEYDAVIFSPGIYSCLPQSASRIETLARLKRHLSPSGRILVSYMTLPQQSPLSLLAMRFSARLARADWRPEPGDSFARDYIGSRVLRYQHMFRDGEVAGECSRAGLRVLSERPTTLGFRCAVVVAAHAPTRDAQPPGERASQAVEAASGPRSRQGRQQSVADAWQSCEAARVDQTPDGNVRNQA
jgi:SAM-dependent methyltransferase